MLCILALPCDRGCKPIESANCLASQVTFPSSLGGHVSMEIIGMQDDKVSFIWLATLNWLGQRYSRAGKCYCSAYNPM